MVHVCWSSVTQKGTMITVLCPNASTVHLPLEDDKAGIDVASIRVDQPSFLWVDNEHVSQSSQTVLKIVAESE